jgi:hypothetical protein
MREHWDDAGCAQQRGAECDPRKRPLKTRAAPAPFDNASYLPRDGRPECSLAAGLCG